MLDNTNLTMMYTMFVRSIMEYGNVVYMGAAKSHLDKLDRVQESAMKLGGFEVESLESRREAATISLAFDLLDGKGYGELDMYKPKLYEPIRLSRKRTRQTSEVGTQIMRNTKTNSLDQFKRSYLGSIHQIWAKIPQTLIAEGQKKSWQSIKSRTKKFLTGQWQPSTAKPGSKKHKQTINGTKQHNIEWNAV